jgi:hypothetical protein
MLNIILQPRSQGFSRLPNDKKGKALGTRLANNNSYNLRNVLDFWEKLRNYNFNARAKKHGRLKKSVVFCFRLGKYLICSENCLKANYHQEYQNPSE